MNLDWYFVPFDPTMFNADCKSPEAAFIEKTWGTNGNAFWLNASLGLLTMAELMATFTRQQRSWCETLKNAMSL